MTHARKDYQKPIQKKQPAKNSLRDIKIPNIGIPEEWYTNMKKITNKWRRR